jgi:VanZ family protein
LAAIIWGVIILIVLCLPRKDLPEWSFFDLIPFFDKVVHAGLFLILAFLLICGIHNRQRPRVLLKIILMVIAITLSYGGLTELLQKLITSSRTADVFDWIADTTGSILGILLFLLFLKFSKRNGNPENK